ncbi:MAG: GvpL/GvpF family gas vesicle protein [Chloroflexi bacterium]|nr:GvpL/GvpF family gas vesicle protein [Chloroflexota bacterium]
MAEVGKYLYCIIPCSVERTFAIAPIDDGVGGVSTICHEGLAAVVSDATSRHYESTRSNLMAHEKVLEAVMTEFTLLPVRFGTVADAATPAQDIHKLLSHKSEEFRELLRGMEGTTELGLKAFWRNEKAIFPELLAENPEIKRLIDSLSARSRQASASSPERLHLGQMVKEALELKRAREAAQILSPLRPLAQRLRENFPLVDRMIANAAFLVEREREPEFDIAVSTLDRQLGQRVAFKYVGPVPPYNFVNIVVNWEEL